ncbi:hypothetical protein L596_017122 [Steinernema carpocapsae]|uniref:Uncharacterized protein n=1 Tax=Steinernema carpocapsae TaxID=34508 RepID=A0A4U5N1E4_STECR|nr:hypothetical protein L596_017122 [Steinernema carpocapsae]
MTSKPPKPSGKNYDPMEGVPPDEAIAEETVDEDVELQSVDDDIHELSDFSEEAEVRRLRSIDILSIYTLYTQLRPLMKSPQVRILALLNSILTFINILLLIGVIIFIGLVTYHKITYDQWNAQDMPCIYEWTEWSVCSYPCRNISLNGKVTKYPTKTRTINQDTIVQARGTMEKCPDELEFRIERVPCNTHYCPRKLSSFTEKTQCFFKNPLIARAGGCFKMLKIPVDDGLIEIDKPMEYYWDCLEGDCPTDVQ